MKSNATKKPAAAVGPKPPVIGDEFTGLSIGEAHEKLWDREIYSKSMIGQWYKCGVQSELRHVYGHKVPPGFVVAMGSTYASLKDVGWAQRILAGEAPMSDEEAEQFVHEEWARQMEHVEEPEAKDAHLAVVKKRRILDAFHIFDGQWRMDWRSLTGELTGAEQRVGYDGSVEVEDEYGTKVRLSATPDMLFENAVGDDKFVGMRSRYRRYNRWAYEAGHVSLVTGKKTFFLFPAIHDFQRKTDVEVKECPQGDDTHSIVISKAAHFKRAIDKGIFPAPEAIPGTFPCHPKWCGYFGRQCPITKHLKREDFE